MTPEQFKEVIQVVKEQVNESTKVAVKEHVNGHIKRLTERLDTYIVEDTQWKKEDKEWKDNAQPSVDLGLSTINWWRVTKWVIGTGIALSGFLLAIQTIKSLF